MVTLKKIDSKQTAYILLVLMLIMFSFFNIFSESSRGEADEMQHYFFARFAFKNPHFFLDLWAKPVFTILSAPFAQFGYVSFKFFNVIIGVLTAFVTFLTARKLNYKNSFLVIIFVCFAPVYIVMTITGMTEIIFSFILILSVYLFVCEKYIASAIVASFLPYARFEGYVILPLFFLALVSFRKFKVIPYLAAGTLFFTLIGYPYYNDWLWLIHKIPYAGGTNNIYGSGSFFIYTEAYRYITGLPLTLLMFAGIFKIFKDFKRPVFKAGNISPEFFLVFSVFFIIYLFHSLTWWIGVGGALGMTRFFAAVIPVIAILAIKGLNFLASFLKNELHKLILGVVFGGLVIGYTLDTYKLPIPLSLSDATIKKTSEWLKNSEYKNSRIIYFDPIFWRFMNFDPTNPQVCQQWIGDKENPQNEIAVNNIVLWDAHFAPNEGGIPLERLANSRYFKHLETFKPPTPFKTLGEYNYEIHAFLRIASNAKIKIPVELYKNDRDTASEEILMYSGFEHGELKAGQIPANTGTGCQFLNKTTEYFTGINGNFKNLIGDSGTIRTLVSIYPKSLNNLNKLFLVVGLSDKKTTYFYKTFNLNSATAKANAWNLLKIDCRIPKPKSGEANIAVYIWNSAKEEYYLDDFVIEKLKTK